MKMELHKNEIEIDGDKLIITITDELRRKITGKEIKLAELKPGTIFNDKYIVLDHMADGTSLVITKELLEKEMKFGDTNDWRESCIREYLNGEYLKEIEEEFGKENIVEHESDLLSLDGLDDYGKCVDKISLLSIDHYRKYRKVIGKNMDKWWWLLTPNSTGSGAGNSCVQCVDSRGGSDCDGCGWSYGVCGRFLSYNLIS